MGISPLNDKIIVERAEAVERTPGGIILPDTARAKSLKGTVVGVGAGRLLENGQVYPPSVKAGDTVHFSAYAGIDIEIEGRKLLIMTEADLLAVAN